MSGEKKKIPDVPSKEIDVGMDIEGSDDSKVATNFTMSVAAEAWAYKGNKNTTAAQKKNAFEKFDAAVSKVHWMRKKRKTKPTFVSAERVHAPFAAVQTHFLLGDFLGGGAQGKVYKYTDPTSGAPDCAVKVVSVRIFDPYRDMEPKEWGVYLNNGIPAPYYNPNTELGRKKMEMWVDAQWRKLTKTMRDQISNIFAARAASKINGAKEALRREKKINRLLFEAGDPSFTSFFREVDIVSEGKVEQGRSIKYKRPPLGYDQPHHLISLLFMPKFDATLMDFLNKCRGRGFHRRKIWENEIKLIFESICEGMASMHKHGVVNRDLKYENIGLLLLRDKLVARIADHGHGSAAAGPGDDFTSRMSGNTTSRGTNGFKAPECGLAEGIPRDLKKVDLYAVGVSLYAMLRIKPLLGEQGEDWRNDPKERSKIARRALEDIESDRKATRLSSESANLLKKMLAVDPADRPCTFEDVLKDDWLKMADDDRKEATQSLIQEFGEFYDEAKKRVDAQKIFEDAFAGGAVAAKYDTKTGVVKDIDETSETTDSEGASKTTNKKTYEMSGPPPDDSTSNPDGPTYRDHDSNTKSLEPSASTSTTRSLRSLDSRGLIPSNSTTRSLKTHAVELVSENYVILPASRPFAWNEALDAVSAAVDMELIEEVVSVRADKTIQMIMLFFRNEKESMMVNVKLAKAQSESDATGPRGALLFELAWGHREAFLSFLDQARRSVARAFGLEEASPRPKQ